MHRFILQLIRPRLTCACALLISNILLLPAVFAHDIDVTGVARVFLDELEENHYQLSIVDQQVPPLFNIERILPERCTGLPPGRFSYRFQCKPALNLDDVLAFPWPLEGLVLIARWADGSDVSGYFPGDGSLIEVEMAQMKAGASSIGNLARRYLLLGGEHIMFGADHLLFVLGLLLLLQGFWRLLKTITAFTIAHSITLACAALGIFPVPGAPIEVLIALSIVFLAREILMAQQGKITLVHKKPWIVAFAFGLIHGFGFASALGELGLSDADIPLALLFFNVGVELGQVAFICALLTLHFAFTKYFKPLWPSLQRGLAYGLGGIASYWFIERIPSLLIT